MADTYEAYKQNQGAAREAFGRMLRLWRERNGWTQYTVERRARPAICAPRPTSSSPMPTGAWPSATGEISTAPSCARPWSTQKQSAATTASCGDRLISGAATWA
jgi:hypothetical protein